MKKVVTLGDLMLRLTAPRNQKLEQAETLIINYGGSEANVSINLARLGIPSSHVTVFPDNVWGHGAERFLNSHQVDTTYIQFGGDRIGIYFLEQGAMARPSQVVYDRYDSSFAKMDPQAFDWDTILEGSDWFHWSGITPALSAGCAQACLSALKIAKRKGIYVSGDIYFRSNLWKYGKTPQQVLPEMVGYCDLIIANELNMKELFGVKTPGNDFVEVAREMSRQYPSVVKIVDTMRDSISASHNRISARMWNGKELLRTEMLELANIVDRIGSGDAFLGGLIYGLKSYRDDHKALEFGNCASAIKHSIEGDANLTSVREIELLMSGDSSGRLRR